MNLDNLYKAKVIENDDFKNTFSPGSEGRIQIYIEPIMKGWSTEDYPWARPFYGEGSTSHGTVDIPEKDDIIWVVAEKDDLKKNWYYLSGVSLKKMNVITKVKTFISSKLKSVMKLNSSHPDIKLKYYSNGIVVGVSSSSSNPEVFIYHPKNSFIAINSDGEIKSKGDWKHEGNFEATKEVTAMSESDATKVTVSKHEHISSIPGSSTATPTPGK